MAQHVERLPGDAHSRPASAQPHRVIQGNTPGDLNVWLFVSVIPVTFITLIVLFIALAP